MNHYLKRLTCFCLIILAYPIFVFSGTVILLIQSIRLEAIASHKKRRYIRLTHFQSPKTPLDTLTSFFSALKTAITQIIPHVILNVTKSLINDTRWLTTQYFTKLSEIAVKGTTP